MKLIRLIAVILLCVVIATTGCSNEVTTDEFDIGNSKNVTNNDDVLEEENNYSETIGELTHGVKIGEDEEEISITYEGEQLEIPYEMMGNGICSNVGFLIYLDGIPQPYMIKGKNEEYKYMHVIEGKDNINTEFIIAFNPVIGKVGDNVCLRINSIANPLFIPDMVNTFDYGMSHKSLEAVYDITFKKNAKSITTKINDVIKTSSISNKHTEIDKKEKQYIQDKSVDEKLDLEHGVYSDLRINDNSMLIESKYNIKGKKKIHISYTMMGHPGIRYKLNFYLNHQLITDDSKCSNEIKLATGKMDKLEFDLDVSKIKDGTLYVLAVPINASDYPNDIIQTIKSDSIHLYKGE